MSSFSCHKGKLCKCVELNALLVQLALAGAKCVRVERAKYSHNDCIYVDAGIPFHRVTRVIAFGAREEFATSWQANENGTFQMLLGDCDNSFEFLSNLETLLSYAIS